MSEGAMIAFSTLVESQIGQATNLRFNWVSQVFELANQLSNSWPAAQIRL
jgi:hypothetical protein